MKQIKKIKIFAIILSVAICVSFFAGCGGGSKLTPRTLTTAEYFATVSTLIVFDDFSKAEAQKRLDETWKNITETLAEIDRLISPAIPDSDISRFNALRGGESVTVSGVTAAIIAEAKNAYELTNGLYDPSVYNLVELWGFSPRFGDYNYSPVTAYDRERVGEAYPLPDTRYIDAFRAQTDFSKVVLTKTADEYCLTKYADSVTIDNVTYQQRIDLGGIAKGYAADEVMELLKAAGYEYGYFSCGTSSMALLMRPVSSAGAPGENQWGVEIVNPRPEEEFTDNKVFTKNITLSTSGDYEQYYILDGIRYSHIIDPRTGYPMNAAAQNGYPSIAAQNPASETICSVTVFGGAAALDDALTTALCLMMPDVAEEFLSADVFAGYKYVIVTTDGGELRVRGN